MADAAAAASKRPRSDSADDAGGSVGESSTAAAQAPAQSHAPTQEGGTGSGEAGAGAAGGGKKKPRLSKQEKKLLRMAARKEKWLQQKRAKKEAKAKLRQRQAEVAGVDAASLGQPKPIDEMDEAERAKREAAQERRAKVREKWRAAVERGTRVVLDCGYEELMTPRERKSMAQQVAFCYGTVKRMRKNPFHLCVTSFGGVLKEQLAKVTGFDSWAVTTHEENLRDAYPREGLVYLSADSDTVLTTVDPGTTYVLGGIVDRNRHKGLMARVAADLGVRTARLPIDEFIKMSTCRVLTTNHVFEIMAHHVEGMSWRDAFLKVIPGRKGIGDGAAGAAGAAGGAGGDDDTKD